MPVSFKKTTVTKKKAQAVVSNVSAKETALAHLSTLVDPLHEDMIAAKVLKAKLAKLDAKIKPKKAAVLEAFNKVYGKDAAEMAEGKEHTIKISAASKSRTLTKIDDCFDLLEGVKEGLFAELAKVTLGDLDKYLTPEQLDLIIETGQDPMSRTITPVVE